MPSPYRIDLQPAFLLHRRPYRDSSHLLECFSRDFGRQGLVARGSRRGKSALGAVLQPFQAILISWGGRGDLGTLFAAELGFAAESGGSGPPLTGQGLWCGYYLNELLLRLCQRGEAYPRLFAVYRQTLDALREQSPQSPALRAFEKKLLGELGYEPLLDRDVQSGEPVRREASYHYLFGQGPVLTTASGFARIPGGLRVSGATLLAIQREEFADPHTRKEAQGLLQALLRPHLGNKPLQSRAIYRSLLQGQNGA